MNYNNTSENFNNINFNNVNNMNNNNINNIGNMNNNMNNINYMDNYMNYKDNNMDDNMDNNMDNNMNNNNYIDNMNCDNNINNIIYSNFFFTENMNNFNYMNNNMNNDINDDNHINNNMNIINMNNNLNYNNMNINNMNNEYPDNNNINNNIMNNINMNNNLNYNSMNMNINNIDNKNLNNDNNINNMSNINMNQNINNYNNMNNNMINFNDMQNDNKWTIIFLKYPDFDVNRLFIQASPNETVSVLFNKYRNKTFENIREKSFIFNNKKISIENTLKEEGLQNLSKIYVFPPKLKPSKIKINIKFIKDLPNLNINNFFSDLFGLLKLCLLKEIAIRLDNNQIQHILNNFSYRGYLMKILKDGFSKNNPPNENNNIELEYIIENIYNFSKYIDKRIDTNCINGFLNFLKNDELKEIKDLSYRLAKYNEYYKLLEKQLEESIKDSIIEFSIISFIVIERENYEAFTIEREECPNKEEKILFYGTTKVPNSNKLKELFKLDIPNNTLYFTDSLDYCWFYGNSDTIKSNRIPKLNETFNLIACYSYFNENGFKTVTNKIDSPNKNEMNLTYVGAEKEVLTEPNRSKFYGTEYKVGDINQICPLISFRLKRNEYCIIWRDDNFSSNSVYYNEYDVKFKKYLEEMREHAGKYNLYPCQSTEQALYLVNRKKYNKIILISNVGKNNEGANFIEKAREIIGNDVICLFIAFRLSHLDWIQNFKNALFSNEPEFNKEYLKCFNDDCYEYERINKIQNLIKKIGDHYNVYFNFDENFLYFPKYKPDGKYNELSFEFWS